MARYSIPLFLLLVASCGRAVQPAWHWNLGSRCYAQPIIDRGVLYVVAQDGTIVAGDSRTGSKKWTVKTGQEIVATPVIRGNSLFLGTQNGTLMALDKESGRTQWRRSFAPDGFEAPLSADSELLVAPTSRGSLLGLSPASGEPLWKISGQAKFTARALLEGPRILVGGWGQEFLSINRSGEVEWRLRASDRIVEEGLFVRNVIFFPVHNGFVYAVDAPTGRVKWRIPAEYPTGLINFAEGLSFASGNDIVVLDPSTGNEVRRIPTQLKINRIYGKENQVLAIARGAVYAVDPAQGTIRNTLPERFSVFRLSFDSGMTIASDETASIFGFTGLQ